MKIDAGGDEVQLRVIHRGVVLYPERREPGYRGQRGSSSASTSARQSALQNCRPRRRRDEVLLGHLPRLRKLSRPSRGMLKPEYEEVEFGRRDPARSSAPPRGNIAGSIVKTASSSATPRARLVRDGSVVADNLTIESLRRFTRRYRGSRRFRVVYRLFNDIKAKATLSRLGEMREKPRV